MNISNDEQINLQTHSESIVEFVSKYKAIKEKSGKGRKLDSVEKFRKAVEEDPVLRMQFQGAIDQIPEELPSFDVQGKMRPAILYQSNIDEAMDLLNLAAQTPPFYTRCELSAVPIATIVLDLINTELGKTLISRPDVNSHLKNIFNDYREMLTTEESLLHLNGEEKGWFSAGALKQVDYADYVCDPEAPHYGFKCWNDWFIRDLAKGARPVDGENDPSIITHAAENYPLTSLTLPARNIKTSDQFWLKENRYSLYDMFSAQKMGVK
jgi:phosphatidylserine decarboxylase